MGRFDTGPFFCHQKMRVRALLSHLIFSSGEPGWVVTARTRHKDIHVGSVATSLSLTVLAVSTHPGSGHADGITIEMF